MTLSPLRAGRITGSRIPAVLGVSPYGNRETVLRDMVRSHFNEPAEFVGNYATDYGNGHEADGIAAYEQATGQSVHSQQQFVIHPDYPFLAVTVDGLVGSEGLVEVKCPLRATYTHVTQRPDYESQIRLQLACTGRAWGDLCVWRPDGVSISRVHEDPWWLASVLGDLEEFLREYTEVIADPDKAGPFLAPLVDERTDAEWQTAAIDYLDALAAQKAADAIVADARARVLELADGKPTKGSGILVTRSERAGSVDYRKVLDKYAPDADLDAFRKPSAVVLSVRQST